MNTNEWKTITKALDSAGMKGLTSLTVQELLKLNCLLDHWQKLSAGEVSKRLKSDSSTNVTQ